MFSCSPKIQTVPEVTGSLASKEIYTFSSDVPVLKMLEKESHFVIVNGRGTISKIEIASGELKFIFQLNFPIHPEIFSRGDYLVMRDNAGKHLVVFDIGGMKIIHDMENPGKVKCIGVNGEHIVLLNGSDVFVHDYSPKNAPLKIELGKTNAFDCQFAENSIYLPTTDTLYVVDTKKWNYRTIAFPIPCISGILLDEGSIYYGSDNRRLIKFNPLKNKIVWKFLLTKKLTDTPQKIFGHIVCTPEDQNIYFISPSGTLDWWQKLNSTRLLHPVPMGENVAVFLFPPESPQVKYFNLKKHETNSYTLDYLIQGAPIYFGQELFILKGQKEGKQKKVIGIAKIGNRYEVDIKTDPKRLLSTGKSIKFILSPVNLIDPEFDVKILNSKKETIFNKKIADAEKAQFNWIPEAEGEYEVSVDSKTADGQQLTTTQPFSVMDIDKLLLDYYLELQQESNADIFEVKKKNIHAEDH